MGMTLLRSSTDWRAYTVKFAKTNKLVGDLIDWDSQAPQEYPCLVATVLVESLVSSYGVKSCIIYVKDAQMLVEAYEQMPRAVDAKGKPIKLQTHKPVETVSASGAEPDKKSYLVADLDDFHKHTAAMLMAIIQELTAIGISTEPRFEAAIAQNLALVDQFAASDREAKRLAKVTGERSVLTRLYPPKLNDEDAQI